jgi:Cu-processing system ATP-binding protein
MIKIRNIEKVYKKFSVLKNMSLDFENGTCTAIMGPNGSGKTTLLKSILGLVIPEQGDIYVDGANIRNNYLYRKKIGYMPQTAYYPENLKSGEVISIIKEIRNAKEANDKELFESFATNSFGSKAISALSQGMKQRLSGALAFMFDSDIIILDEPTAGLDPHSSEILKKKILKEKEKGKLILFTTHIISEVAELADRFIFMYEGNIHIDEKIHRDKERNGNSISELITGLFKKNEWQ